ncbi:M28 family peptidase [Marinibactrum halimedae]|uniref:Carboxypeptidase Q n=1 Tax=Marinibactrum halimedae TaxID=1444977 RepID=A0AA37TAA4_9GAMM|nr:M28 family peptidase [Marinibactrum halimedae]MCD9459581.1 M28 family peptidase [Marinibactrum halimedae]GLS25602.1 peptidase M28 [Marinibactrum halimedae]
MGINKFLIGAALYSFATLVGAQAIDEKTKAIANDLMDKASQSQAYSIVESLTTEVGPRLAGSEAEARARDWAVKKFKKMGFKNVRVDPFDVPWWERQVESAEIVSPFPQPLYVTALGGSVSTPDGGVTGEVAIFPNLAALKAVKDGGLKGKVVFIDELMTRTQDGSGYRVAVAKRRETAYESARVGAVGALIRSVGTNAQRFPHTGQMRSGENRTEPSVPTAALSAPDADQLVRVASRGKPVKVKMTIKTESRPRAQSGNVIAEIPGRTKPEEIVLIGAHLDSWDLGTGAVDDGAGVGIVMGAAKLLMDNVRKAPDRTIRVVLFGSEEVGLVGARAYAKQHKAELKNHVLIAESDFGAGKIWRFDSRVGQGGLEAIAQMQAVLAPLGIAPGSNQASGGPDMIPMREAGVPVVGLMQNGWDYFDLHHTPNDTLDKINPDELNQNVAAYAAFIYMAAMADTRFDRDEASFD